MAEKKHNLTNEGLSDKFKSNFQLVTYAIKLAENMIRTGRDARIKSDIQNRALLILEEIREGKDVFDEIKDTKAAEPDYQTFSTKDIKPDVVDERSFNDRRHSRAVAAENYEA